MNRSDACVLLPAFNEAQRLPKLIHGIRALGFPVVVSDDGSTDGTVAASRDAGAEVLTTPVNAGKGAALRRGFDWFLRKNYAALILMDADGQHDPSELDRFVQALEEGTDMVVGDRMTAAQNMPWLRRLTNRLMSAVLSVMAGRRIPDSQCGYRAITREGLSKLSLCTSHFEIESEMILEAVRQGLMIRSIPVPCVYANEKSRIRPAQDTFRFCRFVFQHVFLNKK